MKNTEIIIALKEQFENECKVFDLRYEYGSEYDGKERYAISSILSELEMMKKYGRIIELYYTPYIYLSAKQGDAIIKSQNNDAKHRMRAVRFGSQYDINDGEFEEHHPELACQVDMVEEIESKENIAKLRKCLSKLTENQRNRIIAHYFWGDSYTKIADKEGVDRTTVKESVVSGIKKLKVFF